MRMVWIGLHKQHSQIRKETEGKKKASWPKSAPREEGRVSASLLSNLISFPFRPNFFVCKSCSDKKGNVCLSAWRTSRLMLGFGQIVCQEKLQTGNKSYRRYLTPRRVPLITKLTIKESCKNISARFWGWLVKMLPRSVFLGWVSGRF